MSHHTLNWTYAYTHRLQGTNLNNSYSTENESCYAKRLEQEVSAGHLPFLRLPFKDELLTQLEDLTPYFVPFKHMLLLGIGGSSLGAKALQKAFHPSQDWPNHSGKSIWIADNIDAITLNEWFERLNPEETLVVVISKSGGTIETMSQFFFARKWLQRAVPATWKKHIIAITDEKHGELRQEAEREGYLSLPVPDFLGGRFSVFSAVGLLPAAFLGIDYAALLRGAEKIASSLIFSPASFEKHPAWRLALWNKSLLDHGYSQLIFFSYIPLWNYLGAWFSQLWAESLGKAGKGSMPVPAVGVTDQHSVNQMFLDGQRDKACIFLTCSSLETGAVFPDNTPQSWGYLKEKCFGDLLSAEALGTRMALTKNGVPLVHIDMEHSSEAAAGSLMELLMATTLLTGWLLEINPLDQPAVELGKRLANARLGASGYPDEEKALDAFLQAENDPTQVQKF